MFIQCPVCGKREPDDDFNGILCAVCGRALGITDARTLNEVVKYWVRIGTGFQQKALNKQDSIRKAGQEAIMPAHSMTMYMAPTFNVQNARRLLYQNRLYERVKDVDGDIVEFGVGTGGTFLNWCLILYDNLDNRQIWGFDSFEGFPEPTPEDIGLMGDIDAWKSIGTDNLNLVLDAYNLFGLDQGFMSRQVTLVKGFFSETVEEYEKNGRGKISLLHLDCDLYESYRLTLEKCAPLVEPFGIIAIDEYVNTKERLNYPGAYKAVDEFMKENSRNYTMIKDEKFGKYYLRKGLVSDV